jgi:Fe-S oxidoreductase
MLSDLVSDQTPIIGIEPSAILTLRDEYLDLVPANQKRMPLNLATHTFLFDEWFAREIDRGNIKKDAFTRCKKTDQAAWSLPPESLILAYLHQKSLVLAGNYEVHLIPSGCCGMAGSFGYEKEHYDVSMQIGELVLFPTVRKQPAEVIIAAPGTSCRHQIKDGTGRKALHPAEILFDALR